MAKHLMIVFSNAVPGREDEFHDWYSNRHIRDVVDKLDGFATAQRFELSDTQIEGEQMPPQRYMAIYEVDDDQLAEAQRAIAYQREEREQALSEGREPLLDVSAAIAEHNSWFFTAITDQYRGGRG